MSSIPQHWLVPRTYTVQGTRQPSRSILEAVIAGEPDLVRLQLAAAPLGTPICWSWEPYTTLQSKAQLDALALVLDDPRFGFDAEFVAACCYFTPPALRDLVCRHPRAQRWVENPSTIWKDAELCYCSSGRTMNVGLQQRPFYAVQELRKWHAALMTRRRWALAFLLAPALQFWMQRRLEEMYAPGGLMFQKGQERWDAAVATKSIACSSSPV